MSLIQTDAVVLHAFSYMESSRILRLATRDAGVVSVLAKGARRASRRFGTAVDLFAEGQAQFYTKPGRELHTLSGFDVVRSRPALASDLGRFTAASAIAELMLLGMHLRSAIYFEAALIIAMLGFVSTVVLSKYVIRRDIVE